MITYPEKNPLQRKRAAAYLRVSTDEQVRSGYSLTEQRLSIEAWCEQNNSELTIFADEGISGRKVNRPGFNALLQAVTENQFDIVLVWRLDRLSRKPSIGYKLRDAMDATRTGFHSIMEGNTVNNSFAFGLWLLIAEQESDIKSERARIGGIGRAKRGLITPKAKYGYRKGEDGRPEIHDLEASTVARIFQQYVEGVPTSHIIEGLHRDGVFTQGGGVWRNADISRTIMSTQYKGIGYYNKSKSREGFRDSKIIEANDSNDWIEISFPVIVDEAIWDAAQVRRLRHKGTHINKGYRDLFPLAGHTFCATCGQRFIHNLGKYKYANGKRILRHKPNRWYSCSEGRHGRTGIMGFKCERPSIGGPKLEKAVWNEVAVYLKNPQLLRKLYEERHREFEATGTSDEIKGHRAKLSSLDEESQRLLTAYQMGHWRDVDVELRMKSINERRGLHSKELDRMESELGDLERRADTLNAFASRALDISSRMGELTEAEKGEIMRSLVPRIAIGKTIDITLVVEGDDATKTDISVGTVNGDTVATEPLDMAHMRLYNELACHF